MSRRTRTRTSTTFVGLGDALLLAPSNDDDAAVNVAGSALVSRAVSGVGGSAKCTVLRAIAGPLAAATVAAAGSGTVDVCSVGPGTTDARAAAAGTSVRLMRSRVTGSMCWNCAR